MMTLARIRIVAVALAAVLLVATGSTFAEEKPTTLPTAPKKDAKAANDAGVTTENAPPVIVKTSPIAGSTDVDPKLTEIKITFSKDMRDGSWSWAQMSDDTFPKTTAKPHYEADHRTCVLPVKLEPGKTYVLLLNKAPFTNFVDTDRRQALEYWLVFRTRE